VGVARLIQSLSGRLDSVFGTGMITASMRMRLRTEQIQAIIDMTPTMFMGGTMLACIVLFTTAETPLFPVMVLWAGLLGMVQLVGLRSWLRFRQGERRSASNKALRRAVINALVLGSLWGVVPAVLLPFGTPAVTAVTAVGVSCVLCAAAFVLAVMPEVAFAFAAPMMVGSVAGLLSLNDDKLAGAFAFLLICYVLVMPVITTRLTRNFVQRLVVDQRIRQQKDIISLLLKEFEENSSDWLWEFDRSGMIDRVSDRFALAAGLPSASLVGQDFCEYLRTLGADNDTIVAEIEHDIEQHATFQDVVVQVERGDQEFWWRLTGKPVYDEQGQYIGYIGTASDITTERLAERRISFLAHNDALTGLLNRGKFTECLKLSVARLERYGSPFTLMFLDLDQFKAVNDTRGHLIGDKLLIQVSNRIRGCVREADVVARLGGDEFAILVNRPSEHAETASLAERLVEVVSNIYEIDGEMISIGVSIGIAIAPINGTRPDQILRNADLALYRAKAEGRGMFRFFESHMDADVRERRMLELELRQALKDDELVLFYQPLVSAEENVPTGFEALVRWNHPIRGLVPPVEFIPIAEQTGLIQEVGDWTIRRACLSAAQWPEPLIVAVNLSAKHFQLSDIASVVSAALAESGLDPARLELEITESLLIERPEDVIEKLLEIKRLGVSIAMDDFGTGYSSLSYLLKFPFDKIKIDKSFVTASSEDPVARDILRSIASLGKTLKIRITAEGVETPEQVQFLRDIACDQLQGFFFAKPLNEPDLAAYILGQFRRNKIVATAPTPAAATLLAG
jgi:diguanylate cyclase (GGDEF)-like protein/PAS domain S-box-containing protein